MVRQHCIPLDAPGEWKEALKGIKHAFAHTWEHCYAMHLTTGLKTYLYAFEKDNIRIVSPIVERQYGRWVDIVKPYGFSGFVGNGDCPEFPHYWREFARSRGYICGYLGVNPIFDYSSHFSSEEIYQYDTIYVLDLTPSVGELFRNLSNNRKRQLNHYDEVSANFALERPILEDFFLENYHDFIRSKSASSVYFFSKATLSYLLSLNNVMLVGAQNSGKLVAVSVFSYTSHVGDYLFNVSLPEGRDYSAALIWYGVNYLKSLGIPAINLGGGSSGEFKRRFGCEGLPLRCLKQIYDPEIYEMACRMANADPNDMTGYFPAYRKEDFDLQAQKVEST